MKLTKQTANDFRNQLEDLSYSESLGNGSVVNYDDEYLYVRNWEEDGVENYRFKYSMTGGKIVIDTESKEEVLKETVYSPAPERSAVEKKLSDVLDFFFGDTSGVLEEHIIKQFDEEANTVIEPLYIAYGEVDGHGDAYKDEQAVHNLVKAFNEGNEKGIIQPSLFHKHKTKSFSIVKAWVNEKEGMLGDSKVPALQPLVEIKFNSPKVFKARVEGRLSGVSIGADGEVEFVKSEFEELKGKAKAKRLIKNFSFLAKKSHLAYTDPSVGGAASLKNEFYLVKGLTMNTLNKEQEDLLEDLEEEFVPLDKKLSEGVSEPTPSTSEKSEEVISGVDNENLNKGKETDMSDELLQKIADLEKKLANVGKTTELEKQLAKYGLADETIDSLTSTLVELSDEAVTSVTKALDSLVEAYEAKVTEVEAAKSALEKSLEGKEAVVENELAKQLQKEHGSADPVEPAKVEEGTLAQRQSNRNKTIKE